MPNPFLPPPGTRFPHKADRALKFRVSGALRGRLTFEEVLDYHRPEAGSLTLFRVIGAEVVGALCLTMGETDVVIDYLTRNEASTLRGIAVGSVLVAAAELFAESQGREVLRLEAFDEPGLIAWYRSRGFVAEGPARDAPGFGPLVPMFKLVEPLDLDL